MTITALPAAPSRSSPSDFSTKADAFLAALPTFVTEANAVAVAMNLNATTATSVTSLAIATGAKSLTVETAKSYQVGMSVMIANDSANWMHGEVTSYNTGTGALVVNVTLVAGSGTKTAWTVTLSGPQALAGLQASVAELNVLHGANVATVELNTRFNNLGIAASVGSKALTVALKGADGNNPSATNPVAIPFRNATLTTGTPVTRIVTGALSVVLSSGSRLGFGAAGVGRLYVWAINDALGAVELALSRTADIFWESNLVSTTAEGGAGAADSAVVMYSTTARSNLACRCIGYIEITTGGTAGEWDNAPTKIQIMGPEVKRTGQVVQEIVTVVTASYTGTKTIPQDDTIPEPATDGDLFSAFDTTITPTSSVNKIRVEAQFAFSNSAAGIRSYGYIVKDSTVVSANGQVTGVAAGLCQMMIEHEQVAGAVAATTYHFYLGGEAGGGTLTINGQGGSRIFGGTIRSTVKIQEVVA